MGSGKEPYPAFAPNNVFEKEKKEEKENKKEIVWMPVQPSALSNLLTESSNMMHNDACHTYGRGGHYEERRRKTPPRHVRHVSHI
jgi:hypothetical protein